MFSRLDFKILIILIVVLALIFLLGVGVYRYLMKNGNEIQNSAGGANTEMQSSDQDLSGQDLEQKNNVPENNAPEVKIETKPGLFICVDKCGDGICQTSDPECKDSMNCLCLENQQECPQDCK